MGCGYTPAIFRHSHRQVLGLGEYSPTDCLSISLPPAAIVLNWMRMCRCWTDDSIFRCILGPLPLIASAVNRQNNSIAQAGCRSGDALKLSYKTKASTSLSRQALANQIVYRICASCEWVPMRLGFQWQAAGGHGAEMFLMHRLQGKTPSGWIRLRYRGV
ncbi:hypothetical protein M431DRAFT_371877 [Trichoderma harzianum CBS 226.95]|uniref:Uncharacterized protein n=1 Tax=Trichoderma harzianum CBS 226.95 TaxID=983964 RepID=A0A2T4AGR9_TRIHA|nr:hypothetical protein M431DRAFT_371877 [Trichoderma harzianum CBS 226.95]PTB56279.1 hypothetical protein M431DRAFT_371877 [Trichoderma harzianum CBS 226.95]